MLRPRILLLWSIVALLILLVAGTVLILIHPVLWTGRYYELTIQSVEFGPHGRVSLTYEDTLTYGTAVLWNYPLPSGSGGIEDYWDRRPGGFMHWPRRESGKVFEFFLTAEYERASRVLDDAAVRQRLLLNQGRIRVRRGDRLVCYRVPSTGDGWLESTIEIKPYP